MARSPAAVDTTNSDAAAGTGETPAKTRKPRSPSAPKAVFAVVQVLGADGEPIKVEKGSVRVVSFERSAEKVLEKVESGEFPNALYLRGMLPAGRTAL